jgi:hypothetical protein
VVVAKNVKSQEIRDRMTAHVRRIAQESAAVQLPKCSSGFRVDDFGVTYPNQELMATVAVTGIPAGASLLGVTVAATLSAAGSETYCMGVAANSAGLPVPVSVLGASTSPSFPRATVLTGLVVLCYSLGGATQECTITQQFTVGG